MATNNPTPIIFDDPSLACIAQQVVFATPWVQQPTLREFPVVDMPRLAIPTMSWVIQDTELSWRERLTAHINTVLGEDHTQTIRNLPGSFISAVIANIFYSSNVLVDTVLPARIAEEMSGSPYAVANYWVGYYLTDMMITELVNGKDTDAQYRIKQLQDLQKVLAYMIPSILKVTPVIVRESHVIVAATMTTSTRPTIYVDAGSLERYFNQGGTITDLCTDYYINKTNPLV